MIGGLQTVPFANISPFLVSDLQFLVVNDIDEKKAARRKVIIERRRIIRSKRAEKDKAVKEAVKAKVVNDYAKKLLTIYRAILNRPIESSLVDVIPVAK